MAGIGLVRGLCEEATCPVCLDYFSDPLMIPECGHNLCKGCLDRYLGEAATGTCPQCRRTFQRSSIGPNRQLANMAEMLKKLSLHGEEGVCEQHREPQKLFCKEDKTFICVTCEHKEHKSHETLLLDEAAQEYRGQIRNRLESLRKEKEKVLARKGDKQKERQSLLEQIKTEREKTVTTFKQLRQFLDEQENSLLAQMEDIAKETERVTEDCLENLSKELLSLEKIIQEMEEKLQQPAADLLQNIENFMESHQETQSPANSVVTLCTVLKWRICDVSSLLERVKDQFQENVVSELPYKKANIHLDPDTAHPRLLVSPDCKSMRWTEMWQDVPDNPERFDTWAFVLGREEFTAGRHFWEVFVESEGEWFVGVARKSMMRKGRTTWGAKGGIWCMGKWADEYRMSDTNTALSLSEEPRKIRVTLNCKDGQVAFYDAERGTLIYEFTKSSFNNEILHPFFFLREGQLSLVS